ncbi:MAG: GTP 3',8-cyclase MoaA [Desulfohalobiaceae bacterium]|nr:GTP 3',8-cyclase MoaA [Desulfohalobiaceae bacterium]
MIDGFGRKINYLRLSVTDRCNLKCYYCSNSETLAYLTHNDILTYEECLSLIRLTDSLGVNKVRLTGGEPFARKDFTEFLGLLRSELPDLDIRVTTNGTLLEGRVRLLHDIGIRWLNISLDTLNREKYGRITGRDYFTRVRQAIDDCLEAGIKVKINCVALNGFNDGELVDFVHFAQKNPVDVRFIEFMPVGEGSAWGEQYFWSAEKILADVQRIAAVAPVDHESENHGPARMYSLVEGRGRIGLISPLSNHFCATCNRFRITPDGKLRTCLFSDVEYDLMSPLRSSEGVEAVLKVMREAGAGKPIGHELLQAKRKCVSVCGRRMSSIGG